MEKFKPRELVASKELDLRLEELSLRKSLVRKVNLFSSDENDEFQVALASGEKVGIFKTWAVPAIPLLELGFPLSETSWKCVEEWQGKMSDNPVLAWQTLEKWRSRSEALDRRLQIVFNERGLPEDKTERLAELIIRLKIGFAFAAPFYHIEAMVGDGNETPGNPFVKDLEIDSGGGFLDMAGMLLPSALDSMVVAERLNWRGLNWEEIHDKFVSQVDIETMAILMRVARQAGIMPEDVIFAANVLEWIPGSVGGKKADLPKSEAIKQLLETRPKPISLSLGMVARNLNGLIRFLNWTPLIKDDVNFSQSAWWKYAAVCGTSNAIITEFSEGDLITDSRKVEFVEVVLKQLNNLDASSARGRFVLWMMGKGWLEDNLMEEVSRNEKRIEREIVRRVLEIERNEEVIELGGSNNRQLVGGKAAGLIEAKQIFGERFVLEGLVVTSESVERWLRCELNIWKKITRLQQESKIEEKLKIAKEIRGAIEECPYNQDAVNQINERLNGSLVAVRSSSFDEDTITNGSAAGIYESQVGVTPESLGLALSKVVASFFSEKAVSYRHLHGLSDEPSFAVVIHEFLTGHGGVVFSSGDGDGWQAFIGETPGDIVVGASGYDTVERRNGEFARVCNFGWVDDEMVELLGDMALLAETVLGGMVDMEFVVTDKGLKILQLRMLNAASEKGMPKKTDTRHWFEIVQGDNLSGIAFNKEGVGLIVADEINIDQFQGELFRCLVKNKDSISEVSLAHPIPRTSHFANICLNLGIKLSFRNESR